MIDWLLYTVHKGRSKMLPIYREEVILQLITVKSDASIVSLVDNVTSSTKDLGFCNILA